EDHRHPARAVGVRDVVAPLRGLRVDADPDQVDVLHVAREVERSHDLVGVDHLVGRRRQRGADGENEPRERRRRRAHGSDQLDLHAFASIIRTASGGNPLEPNDRLFVWCAPGGTRSMPRDYQLISADSHVLEPPHIWTTYVPKKFHDKVPRVVPDGEGGEAWQFAPDVPPAPIGIYASAGRKNECVRWTVVTFAAASQGNFRGQRRLEEQDIDGVDAEVLFGSARMMSHFFSDPDPEFHLAGVQAYNNWLAEEIMSVDPTRLIGLACIPALGVDAAIREMERCLKLGFRGVWLNTMPSVGSTIRPQDDEFWGAGHANDIPVHFHVRVMRKINKPKPKGVLGDDLAGLSTVVAADMITDMSEIISSGVHDRFPDLVW